MESILLTILTTQTLVTAYSFGTQTDMSKRAIVNGHDSPERPFYVRLRVYDAVGRSFHCGGSIIGQNVVLTAGHCVTAQPQQPEISGVEIQYGNLTSLSNAVILKTNATSFVYHPGWNWDRKEGEEINYDIALVFAAINFPLRMMIPRCDHNYPAPNTKLGACGYGQNTTWDAFLIKNWAKNFPTVLQETYLRQDPNLDNCQPDLICTAGNDTSVCLGDSGGPLYVMNEDNEPVCMYGVTSWVEDSIVRTCTGGSFFTSVVYFNDWIQQQIHAHNNNNIHIA